MASPVLGIDLGTTNSVVAVSDGRTIDVLPDAEGNLLTPSTVSFHPNGEVLVGRAARERRLVDAQNTMYSVKRLIGRPFRSPEVRRAQDRFPFEFAEGATGGVMVKSRGDTYSLPEISAFVLRRMRAIAERALGQTCVNAVVTVPANFNELQRTATRDAGSIAGLNILRILNEPTAAALAYGVGSGGSKERVAVYDLGGGTFDVSILELAGDVFEVVATAGDTYLGGDDVDTLIADRMVNSFLEQHRLDLSTDRQTYERLRLAAEWVKCQLSLQTNVTAKVEEIAYGAGGAPLSLRFDLGRPALEQMLQPLVARTFDICEDAMRIAGVRPTQLDSIVLVGGSTRIPLVRKMVAEYFGREPLTSVDPDLVVAQGAALQGYALSGVKAKSPFKATLRNQPAAAPASRAVAKVDTTQPFATGDGKSRGPAPSGDVPADEPTRIVKLGGGTLPPPAPTLSARPVGTAPANRLSGTLPPPTPASADQQHANAGKTEPPGADDIFTRFEPDATPSFSGDVLAASSDDIDDAPAMSIDTFGGDDDATNVYPALPSIGQPSEAWDEPELLAPREAKDLSVLPPRLGKVELTRQAVPSFPAVDDQDLPSYKSAAPPALSRPNIPASVPPRAPAAPPSAAPPPPPPPVRPRPAAVTQPQGFDADDPVLEFDAPPPPAPMARPQPPPPAAPPIARPAAPAPPPVASSIPPPIARVPETRESEPPVFKSPLLLDVTPHTLGVETAGGFCEGVIHRNAPIPTEQSRVFSTSQDGQTDVSVRICQGEERKVGDNQVLGLLELTGLRPAARGEVKVSVTFILDASGTLSVKAKDTGSGREQQIRISLQGGLSGSEVDRMRQRQSAMLGGG